MVYKNFFKGFLDERGFLNPFDLSLLKETIELPNSTVYHGFERRLHQSRCMPLMAASSKLREHFASVILSLSSAFLVSVSFGVGYGEDFCVQFAPRIALVTLRRTLPLPDFQTNGQIPLKAI